MSEKATDILSNLKGNFKDKKTKRLIIFLTIIIIVVMIYAFFSIKSVTPPPPDSLRVKHTPGKADLSKGKNVNPHYLDLYKKNQQNQLDQAAKTPGADYIKPLISPQEGKKSLSGLDDLTPHGKQAQQDETKKISEIAQDLPPAIVESPPPKQKKIDDKRIPAGEARVIAKNNSKYEEQLSKAITRDINSIDENISPGKVTVVANFDKKHEETISKSKQDAPASQEEGDNGFKIKKPALGTLTPAHIIGQVHSKRQGPVLGQIDEGPFAGARIIGSFQQGPENKVNIMFSDMVIPYTNDDGEQVTKTTPIDAMAIDNENLNNGLATSVNKHIPKMILGIPLGILTQIPQMIQQMGSMMHGGSEEMQQMDQNSFQGMGQGAQPLSQLYDAIMGDLSPTIRVAPGTPFMLLWMDHNADKDIDNNSLKSFEKEEKTRSTGHQEQRGTFDGK